MLVHLEAIIRITVNRFRTSIRLITVTGDIHQPNINTLPATRAIFERKRIRGDHFAADAVECSGTKMRHRFYS